jgi:NAD(P)-dependent dehydrogenase (short-subunit alcohol dehydrogenase family)
MGDGSSGGGLVAVITGATSGIGRVAAAVLAQRGDTLILVGRDATRGRAAVDQLQNQTGNTRVSFLMADLSRPGQVQALAAAILERHDRLDLLINNAGAIFPQRTETADGLEKTFALNHLAYYALSESLVPALARGRGARVVNVASAAHQRAVLDFDDLQLTRRYSGWRAYQRSKLANILFTREFARRHQDDGLVTACLHPGFIASRFGDETGGLFRFGLGIAKRVFAESEAVGGGRVAFLATGPIPQSGGYYVGNLLAVPSAAAQSDEAARRLWQVSQDICRPWMGRAG